MSYKTSMYWCIAALVICCLGIMLTPSFLIEKPRLYYSPDYEESYTAGDFDLPQIRKIYRLSPTDDPSYIPTDDFELNGWSYHMLEMDKEEAGGQIEPHPVKRTEKKYKDFSQPGKYAVLWDRRFG